MLKKLKHVTSRRMTTSNIIANEGSDEYIALLISTLFDWMPSLLKNHKASCECITMILEDQGRGLEVDNTI